MPDATVGELVETVAGWLEVASIPNARAEARDVVATVLDVPRYWPSVNRDAVVGRAAADAAGRAAEMRARGAPFAYAVGRAAFRHLTLDVNEHVLIPRQETEVLVDLVLELGLAAGGVAVDVGTGSGAIAIALATEARFDRVIGTDVSLDAIAVARRNATHHASSLVARVDFRQGSLLSPLGDMSARAIVSNPPYVAYSERDELPPSVRDWEPPLALLSGGDGLAASLDIIRRAPSCLEPGGVLALEVDTRRAAGVAAAVAETGAFNSVQVRPDLTGRERFVLARRV